MTTAAARRYGQQWRADRAQGIARTVPAAPIRRHLELLVTQQASYRGIGEVSGVSVSVVARIAGGRQQTVSRRVADALLNVTAADLTRRPNPAGFVPKVGAVRRIRALQAIGHCARNIAAATTLTEAEVYLIVNQAGRWITRARWEAVATAYEHLSMTPGDSAKARAVAAAAGYPTPLAWDDDALDDELATVAEQVVDVDLVDEVAVAAAMAGRRPVGLRPAERVEAVRRLAELGCADSAIADRLGVCDRTVLRWRQEHQIPSRWAR